VRTLKKYLICLLAFLFLTLSCTTIEKDPFVPGYNIDYHDIFCWVAKKLEISENQYPFPEIRLVSKEKLQKTFEKLNEESFKRWADKYGKEMADEMIAFYLKETIGLFVPKTCVIYVWNGIEFCKFKSIIAHEMTHYIQHMQEGRVSPGSEQAEMAHLFREMQAGKIEKDFLKEFCLPEEKNEPESEVKKKTLEGFFSAFFVSNKIDCKLVKW